MKKIVFVTLRMADNMEKRHFPVDGNAFLEYEGEVYYAVNAVLAKTLKKNDDVKIILFETEAGDKAGSKNAQLFMEELNSINETLGANIHYEIIPSDFVTSKGNMNNLYIRMIKNFEGMEELSADITFGPKFLPLLIFSAMQFGEKFFDCSIGNVIYKKTEFKNGKIDPDSQLICDYTPLYLINSFINTIESSSGENAIKAVETLLED